MNGEASGERRAETTGTATPNQNGYILQKSDSQEEEIQDVFFEITKSIASEELRTFGIHLGCQDHKINFLIENNKYVQDAAYKLLLYAKEKYADDAKMWKKIIEALEILEKNRTIKKLRLKEILTAAQEKHPVIITVRKRSCGKDGRHDNQADGLVTG